MTTPMQPSEPRDHERLFNDVVGTLDRLVMTDYQGLVQGVVTAADRLASLKSLGKLAAHINYWERRLVTQLRLDGATWAAVGEALGVTRSAAQQRFGTSPWPSVAVDEDYFSRQDEN